MTYKALTPLALLLIASACARTEPVDDSALDEIEADPVVPTLEETEVQPSTLPSAMSWAVEDDTASYGDGPEEPVLQIACEENENGIILTRFGAEGRGSAGTLSIVGNGASAAVPVVAAEAGEEGVFNWTATLAQGELAQNIVTAFAADEPVNITATSVDPLILTATPDLRDLLARCAGGSEDEEAEDAEADALTNAS